MTARRQRNSVGGVAAKSFREIEPPTRGFSERQVIDYILISRPVAEAIVAVSS
jgi:hypothetical protein